MDGNVSIECVTQVCVTPVCHQSERHPMTHRHVLHDRVLELLLVVVRRDDKQGRAGDGVLQPRGHDLGGYWLTVFFSDGGRAGFKLIQGGFEVAKGI
jgi:hypothetical protein